MKLVQFHIPGLGKRAGVVMGDSVADLSAIEPTLGTVNDIIIEAHRRTESIEDFLDSLLGRIARAPRYPWAEFDAPPEPSKAHLLAPLDPPEVWGFGVTYKRSAQARDEDTRTSKGIYDLVYESARPELFFKGTPSRCAGPNAPIGIRRDSNLTAAEPELAYVIGFDREIVGYTVCNDVSAWDIERENPLYLPQSKVFYGCCAIGPALVTPSEVGDPYSLRVTCRIYKGGKLAFEESVNTSRMNRRFEELTEYLSRDNPVPPCTVVTTGTGIMVPNELALADGDTVEIEIERIGKLANPVKKLGKGS